MNPPDIQGLIHIIKTGNRQDVKKAQQAIESAWHTYYLPNREAGKKAFEAFLDEIKIFDQIPDVDHQAYFISSLKWAFWTIGEEYFEIWAAFVLQCIQHPSGKIRQSIIHITDILVLSLRDLPRSGEHGVTDEGTVIRGLISHQRFGRLVLAVEELLHRYYEPKYRRYKYISSLPVGIYKSLQMLLTEKLLPSEYYENLYNEFLRNQQASTLKSSQPN